MSYASDDLAPLLAAQPSGGVGFRQGKIIAWNPTTAENTVDIGGATVDNLPILNTNEASQLAAGDVVGILATGGAAGSWAILGRLTIPGTPQAASALSAVFSRIVAARNDESGTRNSENYGDLTGTAVGPSVTVNISNNGKALALWSVDAGAIAWRRFATFGVSVQVSGATSIAPSADFSLGPFFEHPPTGSPGEALVSGGMQAAMVHLFTGLNPGPTTFTLKYRHAAAAQGEGAVDFSNREIAVFAM